MIRILWSVAALLTMTLPVLSQESSSIPSFMGNIKSGKHFEPDSAYDANWFSMLDEEATHHKVFFTGENHNYKKINAKLKVQIFKYLHEKAGVNVFAAEMGWSCAHLHNMYLQTGDTSAWDVISKYTFPSNQQMLKDLRAYWLTQPDDKKFVFVGVEFDREPEFGIKLLSMLIPETTAPLDSIRFEMEALTFMDGYIEHSLVNSHKYEYDELSETVQDDQADRYYNQYTFLKNFIDHYNRYKSYYKTWLNKNYDKWDLAVQSIIEYQKFDDLSGLPQSDLYREERMANELEKIIKETHSNIYGQFGRCHINLQKDKSWCGFYYFRSLAYRMSQKPELQNQVSSIPILYMDKVEDYKNSEFEVITDYFNEIRNALEPGITLIQLEGEDTITNTLKGKYKYIFIYKPYSENEVQEAEAMVEESIEKAFETVEKMKRWSCSTFGYGMTQNFTEPLHDFYNSPGLKTISQPGYFYNMISTNISEKKNTNYSTGKTRSRVRLSENFFCFMVPNRQNIGDTFNVVLKSWQIGSHMGIDLLKKKEHWCFFLGYGMIYQQNRFKVYRYANQIPVVNPTQLPNYQEMTNPAILLDALLDLRYVRKKFCMFIRGTAAYDVSNKYWKINKEVMTNTPKTSWSSWFAQAGIGIAIEGGRKTAKNLGRLIR